MTVENKEIGESQIPKELESTKTAEESPAVKLIDKRREEVENLAIEENTTHSKAAIEQLLDTGDKAKAEDVKSDKPEETKEDVQEIDLIDRVKSKVQKRIDKEVAKRKTVEEQLEETRQELAEIRSKQNQQVIGNKDDAKSTEPTLEQISAYRRKVRNDLRNAENSSDGSQAAEERINALYLEEARVDDYISERRAKAERKSAMEELDSRTKKVSDAQAKQLQDWNALQNDYVTLDDSGKVIKDHDLTLSNQNGRLYKTAMALFHNEDHLKPDYDKNGEPIPKLPNYKSDPDKVMGFRRAVSDAFIAMHRAGVIQQETLTVEDAPKAKRRQVLVEPSSDGADVTVEVTPSRNLSDNDKVMDEIMSRRKYQQARVPVRQ